MLQLVMLGPLAGLGGYYFLSDSEIMLSAIGCLPPAGSCI
jgi:hypothetical protein